MSQDLLRHLRSRMSHKMVSDYIRHHQPSQVYIRVDTSNLQAVVHSQDYQITTIYSCPSLAEAVIRARNFCRQYYHGVPVLEYNQ